MEQRSEHQYMPLAGAATDPAYVPGLLPAPVPAAEKERALDAASLDAPKARDEDAAQDAVEEARAEGAADARAEGSSVASDDGSAPDDDAAPEADAAVGPSCAMSDHQGSIVADHRGIRLQLGDEEAEFRWDELSAVEYRTPRLTRRFEIAVYTSAPRRFSHDVRAADRAELAAWGDQLDAVLDAYFED
ncbi:hypothetical protein ACFYN0_07535 [Streptomyces sp. NPDC006704]|uniref:hypothetical protein n=1 Tax=Streptomyces sp. NPDC006704 TaxID=3364760 RepID=UPI0036A8023A